MKKAASAIIGGTYVNDLLSESESGLTRASVKRIAL